MKNITLSIYRKMVRAVRRCAVEHGSRDKFHFPYTERMLLADMTPEKAHADMLAKPVESE